MQNRRRAMKAGEGNEVLGNEMLGNEILDNDAG